MISEQGDVFRLCLLRHAHAAWPSPGTPDFQRALDATGIAEARSVGFQAYAAGLLPEQIVSSPARRCSQTTQAFVDIFGTVPVSYDDKLYSDGLDAYLEQIRQYQARRSLMLVGHNPMIESLATFLTRQGATSATLAHGYPTAGLLVIDFDRPLTANLLHRGQVAALITPALI